MNENKTNINWYPGHMAKTKREIKERIDLIDIVYEIIDARIPYSSKNNEVNELIKNKPRILIMTKKDLCDINITKSWVKYYEDLGYKVILLDLVNNPNMDEVFKETNKLLADFNKKRESKGLNSRIPRALVLGIPNVGKSTFINRLVHKKVTNVGNKPGVTKKLEWIRTSNNIELLDTPGILWPRLDNNTVAYNLASMSSIKEEVLDNEDLAIYIINALLKLYPNNIINRYNLTDTSDIVTILDSIGKKIGAIKNKETDYDRVYNTVIRDLREGYLGKITFDRIGE